MKKWVNPEPLANRISEAQQKMNVASTEDSTAYWIRVWRARRKCYRKLKEHNKELE